MNSYAEIVVAIINEQFNVIGPVAVERAQSVSGLTVQWGSKSVTIEGDPLEVIDRLVLQYKELFGQISVEVCREAALHVSGVSVDQLPKSLQ
jgi:hypothetical protein